jgi:murein DD-endopeptidase MepM/ murein hydrolase activator NlpD
MRRTLIPLLIVFSLLPVALASAATIPLGLHTAPAARAGLRPVAGAGLRPSPPTPTPGPDGGEVDRVEAAVLAAVQGQQERILGFLVNDVQIESTQLSADQAFAASLLVMVDPESGAVLPAEPGLALAQRAGETWQVTLPADPGWEDLVRNAPTEVLGDEQKETWLEMQRRYEVTMPSAPLRGYLLPWQAGQTVWVSQTVAHDRYTPSGSAHFSFDFYVPQTMFRLYAAKAGTVWRARWDVPNGDDSGVGNYIVLQDTTTDPASYQLYLHLAQESIPAGLRETGATVVQGQFIGLADDTGQSSGHHLHYQVHTNPDSYWGTAVDITFADVDINGGRPRVTVDQNYCDSGDVCDSFRSSYISGNAVAGDIYPPTGGILDPLTGAMVKAKQVRVEAWASDVGSGLEKARLLAYYNDVWREIGSEFTGNLYALDWDLCAAGVPDGPVSLSLRAWDREGNPSFGLPGLTHFTKDYDCSPPPQVCTPAADQVALHSAPDFQGECVLLGAGGYPESASFGVLGDDNVASVQVGSSVLATLYTDADYAGRGETLAGNDANLSDNLVGTDTATSLRVRARSAAALKPAKLIAPTDGARFPAGASIFLAWRDPGGATQFQAQVLKNSSEAALSSWLENPRWDITGLDLAAGTYTWRVRARNCTASSCRSGWSDPASFTLTAEPAAPTGVTAPFSDNVEGGANGWTVTGQWNRLNDAGSAHGGSYSWYFGDASDRTYKEGAPSGDLTSRPITIPAQGYALRFWYWAQTEGPGGFWDQRTVQISTNNGPFKNLRRLRDDPADTWLKAEIDLSAYAGDTVRLRFRFDRLDGAFNGYEGWYIDDLSISADPLPDCSDSDNRLQDAVSLAYGETMGGSICPSGDMDYYTFSGAAGDHIAVDIDSNTADPPGDLDLILFLLDGDGLSELAQSDDEIAGELFDPHLGYTLTRAGDYYLKVRQWSHPSGGGEDYTYSIRLTRDSRDPTASFSSPESGGFLPAQVKLQLSASDTGNGSGVSRVEFRYHPGDWLTGQWQVLGTDYDGSDGWSYEFDASTAPQAEGLAFYASVYDWAGNWTGTGAWNLTLDRTAPVTSLTALEGTQASNAILLQWTGSDNLSGIDYYQLQSKKGSGAWTGISPDPDGAGTETWFVGQAGASYSFRMRGVDVSGNLESYPDAAEATTAIPAAATLCAAPDAWDSGRDDNSASRAPAILVDGTARTHNFCNPLSSGWAGDEDWVRFSVEKGRPYITRFEPLAGSAAAILELYGADGATLLAQSSSAGFGASATLQWTATLTGRVYLRARHLASGVLGDTVTYTLSVNNQVETYLPLVKRTE